MVIVKINADTINSPKGRDPFYWSYNYATGRTKLVMCKWGKDTECAISIPPRYFSLNEFNRSVKECFGEAFRDVKLTGFV